MKRENIFSGWYLCKYFRFEFIYAVSWPLCCKVLEFIAAAKNGKTKSVSVSNIKNGKCTNL
jgi:hypothetical protein